jgi:hypothetical protein
MPISSIWFCFECFLIKDQSGVDGKMILNTQFDRCHGMPSEITMQDGTNKKIYQYVLNREYLYSVGCSRRKLNYIQAFKSTKMRQTTLPINPNSPHH